MNQLFTSLAMLCVILFAGCTKDEPTIKQETKPITYSATYNVSEISDDFFDLGSFIVSYTDKEGKEQVANIEKAQIPFSITIKDLNVDSKLSFDLIYGYQTGMEPTKPQYTFSRKVSLTIKGSNSSMYSSSIKSGSLTFGKDKVIDYLDKVTQEAPFESTVQQFISKK